MALGAAPAGPRFRQDLAAREFDEAGVRWVEVLDPRSGVAFRFYGFEHALALAMDGRPVAALAAESFARTGLTLSVEQIEAFAARLGELAFLEPEPARAVATEPDPQPLPRTAGVPEPRPAGAVAPRSLRASPRTAALLGVVSAVVVAAVAWRLVGSDERDGLAVRAITPSRGPAHAWFDPVGRIERIASPPGWRARFELAPEDAERARRLSFCLVGTVGKAPHRAVACAFSPAPPAGDGAISVDLPALAPLVADEPVRLARSRFEAVYRLPASAVVATGDLHIVYVVAPGDHAEARPVTLADGHLGPDGALVTQGLGPGDRVIVERPPGFQPGARVEVAR